MLDLALSAGAGALLGWLGALLWRLRARVELLHLLDGLDGELRRAAEAAALERVRAGLAEGAARQAELRAVVAEAEAEDLRLRLQVFEVTPCVKCGVPPPLCSHGQEERRDWLLERRGGVGEPGWERLHRYR